MLTSLPHDLCRRILRGSPDAILICDRKGIVRYWNAAAERVFGFGAEEAVGASMEVIVPERLRARHWAGWEKTMTTGLTHYGDGQLLAVPAIAKGGRPISIEFSIQLIKGADRQIEWVVAIIRDVTERYGREKAARAELADLKARAVRDQGAHGATGRRLPDRPTRSVVRS
jgi:PAS domain S-box-containing protein